MICAAVLTGLLSAWVATGGTGSIVAQRVQVTQAAVPMRGFTAAAAPSGPAGTFLTIWNPGRKADELLSVSSPSRAASCWSGAAARRIRAPWCAG